MKSFMSAALQDTEAPKGATECNSCNGGGAVTTTGQESTEAASAAAPTAAPAAPQELTEKNAVVMQGPLGTAITEALNKSLSKKNIAAPVQGAGVESYVDFVHANGMVKDTPPEPAGVSRISKSVGLVPATDVAPTAINTLLDAASKVDDIEFIMVNTVESNPSASRVPQKSILQCLNKDGSPANESIAIESVQVIVNYKKIKE